MPSQKSREIWLKKRPEGIPSIDDFELVEVEISPPKKGEVLVRNIYLSVDPYMLGRMKEQKSYILPFDVGKVMEGGAIGQVNQSNNPKFRVGDFVKSMKGWREWFLSDGSDIQLQEIIPGTSIQSYLGALGMTGLTAYAGLLRIAELKQGERVFVSAASGAVGQIACQIASANGCYVVGSVGSDEKKNYLIDKLGIDQAINYKTCGDLDTAVARAFPEGMDVYFENVGGLHLEAAINSMREFGRIAVCGMISQYGNTKAESGPRNLTKIIGLSLRIQGFLVSHHYDLLPKFLIDMHQWISKGQMKWEETIYDGIEQASSAFIGLFKGENIGKTLIRVALSDSI